MGKNKKKTGKKAKSHPHVEDVDETVNKPEEIINSVNVTVPPKMSTDPEADGIVASPDDEGKDLSEGVDKQKVNDGLTVDTINPLEDKKAGDEMKELREEIERLKLELSYKKDQETPNEDFKNELANVIKERDEFKTQYDTLLSKISSMKSIFNKMKEAQKQLEEVQEQLTEYESQNLKLKKKLEATKTENSELQSTIVTLNTELENLEKEQESTEEVFLEYESRIEALEDEKHDIIEKHSKELNTYRKEKDQLNLQVQELMIILENNKQDISDLRTERDELRQALESHEKEKAVLKNSLNDLELKIEEVDNKREEEVRERDQEVKSLRSQLDTEIETHNNDTEALESMKKQLEAMKEDASMKEKYEEESKQHILQIGKLRHEAIILNEHLTKALAMLKKSSDSESVDKELISNLLISFVSIPRADPRKFEVLELLSNFLNWDEDKKQQAGLISNNESKNSSAVSRTESFVSLWTNYLEKESEKD
ncbi:ADI_G0057430.mRNA.1.CDS.1 [Saccharomyces cerevisiae]|nr:Rud3p [Saccharomyces cerevisiae YJM993]AJT82910.1 Rud3p [Saccharomyces cerevisiae YJM969]AJT83407.1 Rud3p [Saccharomyces cerevisiae YJM972]AJT83892.1 Rud3p [Saccharomyces cerevisiae YJM975]AJT84385.1 Rud3p [Saccharomyces cerevisiae YJM978]AJT84877.1 Rud3p [Saccharomyces cerevisiae YJM981]AJT85372.1 Rud3p [Saccharomyces cerevisiae YJM984]AJT85861.1 Rud3p [Saccharomyces cerevisiae YJM987]AJT86355.1 Rud3p [Saccharomyces cerevisiae YJM990]AJT86850.1 Rud3p [Saccharomyces cerevisiae YJM996]C